MAVSYVEDLEDRLRVEISDPEEKPDFARDVLRGFSARQKSIPPLYFYDSVGSRLFEQITRLPEYYLTRTEQSILEANAHDILACSQGNLTLVEFGSGSSRKTRLLIEGLLQDQPHVRYHPIDISSSMLVSSAKKLLADYPDLEVIAHVAEYAQGIKLLAESDYEQKMVLFLGSSLGNFEPAGAVAFLRKIRQSLAKRDFLLLGTDMRKDREVLEAAYNDSQGVTARFNLNLLHRINAELDGRFPVGRFAHEAPYNREEGRIEMYLRSLDGREVRIGKLDRTFHFEAGETIHTENSYKFSPEQVSEIAEAADFHVAQWWSDERDWFRVNLLTPNS